MRQIIIMISLVITMLNAKNNWEISVESGSGYLGSVYAGYSIKQAIYGIGTGGDFSQKELDGNNYKVFYLSSYVFAKYSLFKYEDKNIIDVRIKTGINYMLTDIGITKIEYELTPEILVGAYNVYEIFSFGIIMTDLVIISPQIGIGYRVKF